MRPRRDKHMPEALSEVSAEPPNASSLLDVSYFSSQPLISQQFNSSTFWQFAGSRNASRALKRLCLCSVACGQAESSDQRSAAYVTSPGPLPSSRPAPNPSDATAASDILSLAMQFRMEVRGNLLDMELPFSLPSTVGWRVWRLLWWFLPIAEFSFFILIPPNLPFSCILMDLYGSCRIGDDEFVDRWSSYHPPMLLTGFAAPQTTPSSIVVAFCKGDIKRSSNYHQNFFKNLSLPLYIYY